MIGRRRETPLVLLRRTFLSLLVSSDNGCSFYLAYLKFEGLFIVSCQIKGVFGSQYNSQVAGVSLTHQFYFSASND